MGGMLAIAVLIEAPVFFTSISQSSSNDVLLAGPPSLVARARAMLERRRDYRVVGTVAHLPDHVTLAYLRTHGHAGAAIAISERGRRLHLDIYPRDLSAFDGAQFRDLVPLNIELATGASVARSTAPSIRSTKSSPTRERPRSRTASRSGSSSFSISRSSSRVKA